MLLSRTWFEKEKPDPQTAKARAKSKGSGIALGGQAWAIREEAGGVDPKSGAKVEDGDGEELLMKPLLAVTVPKHCNHLLK